MAERSFIPGSPACGQWETLLAEALDGLLRPEDEAVFTAHKSACPACAALFEEARRGREWLEFLSPEPEIPAGLLDKILAHTGPGQTAGYTLATSVGNVIPMIPAWQRPGLMGGVRRFAEPRLMMTAAMAFFSIAMTLNMTGVRLSDLRFSNLRPSAVRSFMERRLTMASTPIIRYYDHLRLVYEVQTRMRELRRNSEGEGEDNRQKRQDSAPGESKHAPGQAPGMKDGGSRVEPPQQSGNPVVVPALEPNFDDSDSLETYLRFQLRPAHSGGSQIEIRERSTKWTA
ncbi:MAG: zf-HC2 domain-containing protein [Terracidiphilus sp.]|jgi:hypothetical protein